MNPVVDHHDGVEGHADDSAAFNECFDLVIVELAVPIGDGAAVVMAGPNGTTEAGESVPEGFVAKVSDIENDVEVFHLLEEIVSAGSEGTFVVGAMAVDTGAIVNWTESDEAAAASLFQMFGGEDGVCAFEAEQITDGEFDSAGCVAPKTGVSAELLPGTELDEFTSLFHGAIPGELPLGLSPGLFWRLPARELAEAGGIASDLGGDAEADAATTHLWQADGVVAAIGEILHADFTTADVDEGLAGITIPLECVHREVEVGVEDE